MFNYSVQPSGKVVQAIERVDLVAFAERWDEKIKAEPTYENFRKLTLELYKEAGFNTNDPDFIKLLNESAELSVEEAKIQKRFAAFEEKWMETLNRLAPELEDS